MAIAICVFVVVFLLIASGSMLLFYRESMMERVAQLVTPAAKRPGALGAFQQSGVSLGAVLPRLAALLPKSETEISLMQQRLTRAGYRNPAAVRIFYGAKVLVPLLLCALAVLTGIVRYNPIFVLAMGIGPGFLAADFWLGKQVARRQERIRRGLPDVLDLIVICIEAGLSLDQAVSRTAEELRGAQPAICDELHLVILEQRAGRPRAEAWKGFAERTDVVSVRNLVSVLAQAEQFGTSVAKTLRVHSESSRTRRRQNAEERAAKATVKLVFPLVLFIFPSLFLVVLGPSIIQMMEYFKNYISH
jgi:tight adherence protein C